MAEGRYAVNMLVGPLVILVATALTVQRVGQVRRERELWTQRTGDALRASWMDFRARNAPPTTGSGPAILELAGKAPSPIFVITAGVCAAAFPVVAGLQLLLNYQILKPLHPLAEETAVPLATAMAATTSLLAVAMTTLFLGHAGERFGTADQQRLRSIWALGMFACVIAVSMFLAPNRSAYEYEQEHDLTAQRQAVTAAQARAERPGADQVEKAKAQILTLRLQGVEAQLRSAQEFDRGMPLVLAVLEVLGGWGAIETAALVAARRTRDAKKRAARQDQEWQAAVGRWLARMARILTRYGVPLTTLDEFQRTVLQPAPTTPPTPSVGGSGVVKGEVLNDERAAAPPGEEPGYEPEPPPTQPPPAGGLDDDDLNQL